MQRPWFGAKTFGIGVGPKSWEGWLVIAVFAGTALALPRLAAWRHGPSWIAPAGLGLLLLALLIVMTFKGDGKSLRWRAGPR